MLTLAICLYAPMIILFHCRRWCRPCLLCLYYHVSRIYPSRLQSRSTRSPYPTLLGLICTVWYASPHANTCDGTTAPHIPPSKPIVIVVTPLGNTPRGIDVDKRSRERAAVDFSPLYWKRVI
jgi:hypothetical protein